MMTSTLTERDEPITIQQETPGVRLQPKTPEQLQAQVAEIAKRWKRIQAEDTGTPEAPDPGAVRERERDWAQDHLRRVGLPWENRQPAWSRLADELRGNLFGYCERLEQHLAAREGFFICGAPGSMKTTGLALVAMSAGKQGASVAYCPAGFVLVDKYRAAVRREERRNQYDEAALSSDDLPYADADLLLLDDLDYVTTDGYDAELRSYDAIGQFLYLRYAAGQTVCCAANLSFTALAGTGAEPFDGKQGLERVASRWQLRIPPALRLVSTAVDQRAG